MLDHKRLEELRRQQNPAKYAEVERPQLRLISEQIYQIV
jgi:hypothetical protein